MSLHRGRGRKIQPGQRIHASVAFCKTLYEPKALFSDKGKEAWCNLIGRGNKSNLKWTHGWEDRLEMDIFDNKSAEITIEQLGNRQDPSPTVWVHRLTIMMGSGKIDHQREILVLT